MIFLDDKKLPIDEKQALAFTLFLSIVVFSATIKLWNVHSSDQTAIINPRYYVETVLPGEAPRLLIFNRRPSLTGVYEFHGRKPPAAYTGAPIREMVKVIVRPEKPEIMHPSGEAVFCSGGKLDANIASARDFILISGIGPSTARRITRDREQNGPYSSINDLKRVKGIGPWTVNKMRPFVLVGPK